MELVLNRPFVREFNDRTKSKRPPREALAPPAPCSFLSRLIMTPGVAKSAPGHACPPPVAPPPDSFRICAETLPVLAFWGD